MMDDLISRKAAIAELDHAAWGKEYDKELAKAMLESLPSISAQLDGAIFMDGWNSGYYSGWQEGQEVLRKEMWERERERFD